MCEGNDPQTLAHFVEFNGMYGHSLDSFLFQAKYK